VPNLSWIGKGGWAQIRGKPVPLKFKSIQILIAGASWNDVNSVNFVKIVQGIRPLGAHIFRNLVKILVKCSVFWILYPYHWREWMGS